MSFPLKDSDAYIESTGKRSTLGKKLSGGGYELPTASNNTKGGVKIGSGLTMVGEVLTATQVPNHTGADAGKVLTVNENGELEWDDNGGEGGEIIPSVPAAYQKVEYITFNNAYITLPLPDGDTQYKVKFRPTRYGEYPVIAAKQGNDTSNYDLEVYAPEYAALGRIWTRNNTYSQISYDDCKLSHAQTELQVGITYSNAIIYDVKFTIGADYSSEIPAEILRLGSYYGQNYYYGDVFYLKTEKDGDVNEFYVPCYRKSDNVIGFYDTVNDIFYVNEGSGSFSKGGDV